MSLTHPLPYFLSLALVLTIGSLTLSPITQPESYHLFADKTGWAWLPNALNVLTNLAFAAVAIYGFLRRPRFTLGPDLLLGMITFLIGLLLISLGSAYYHWAPSSDSLLWDRLPLSMTLMGGASFSLIVAQTKVKRAFLLYMGMQLIAIGTTLYWYFWDDLRFYAMCQVFPMGLLLLSVIRLRRHPLTLYLALCLIAYIIAKFAEYYDQAIFDFTSSIVSGHSVKHLFAALGGLCLLRFFLYLKPTDLTDPLNEIRHGQRTHQPMT